MNVNQVKQIDCKQAKGGISNISYQFEESEAYVWVHITIALLYT